MLTPKSLLNADRLSENRAFYFYIHLKDFAKPLGLLLVLNKKNTSNSRANNYKYFKYVK